MRRKEREEGKEKKKKESLSEAENDRRGVHPWENARKKEGRVSYLLLEEPLPDRAA